MQDDGKINLDKSAQEKYKSSTTLNKKNIIKAIAVIIAGIIGISLFFNFLFSNPKDEEKKEDENILEEKAISDDLKKQDYSNRNVLLAADETLSNIKDENTIDYNVPAEEPVPVEEKEDPMETFLKEQELEKLKRKYDARKSAFKSKSNNAEYEIISQTPDTADSYTNDLDYLKYLTSEINQTADPNMQKEKKQFLKNAAVQNFVLKEPLTPSISKYEVKTGTYIPITLVGGINSDLPGHLVAIVREDIYDTNTGTVKIIPAGSRLFGTFSSEVSWGQTRVQVVFNRLTLPNGKSINLGAMGAADLAGQSGLTGDVNMHLGKVIGSIVMAGIVGGADGALTNNGNHRKDENSALSKGGEESGRTAIETVDKYSSKILDVQPTITVKPGTRGTIVVEEDIILEKYDSSINYLIEE
ncbi:TrbI/VirB10 family protein [Fusobacterium polymorphum]|uniref:Conjugal transfer protein TrbI n=1 Tax=Fusobacterium nucleatum subsp. polymorphum TaxID=76857 RepID=A0A2C6C9N7_FUSNP|nr:TrbI/VirB10 family protein [Fusobacterium polymorphum]PHI15516.1 conjugal transfer protein TrbI [Fusobacterium polymorphum]